MQWLDDEQQRAWRGWIDAHAQLTALMNRELQAHSGLSVSDYAVLVVLTDVDAHTVRMFELCDKLQWEKSRLSKQVSRMAARGLVAREEVPDDRRGAFVRLTDEGLAAIRRAAPSHVELVRRTVFAGLTPEQVRTLGDITEVVLDRLRRC